MFLTIEDAKMRLGGTVVSYKGELVFILSVDEKIGKDYYVRIVPLDVDINDYEYIDDVKPIKLDKNFDLTPVLLGNVDYKGTSFFVMRKPSRMWKTGLHRDNLIARTYKRNWCNFKLHTSCLSTVADNDYKSTEEAYEMVSKDRMESCSLSREFSLVDGGNILAFKNTLPVGFYIPGSGIELEPKFEFLKELLDEGVK